MVLHTRNCAAMEFRPCIDLKDGRVVQIVGGSLSDDDHAAVQTNFSTDRLPVEFAELYQQDRLTGGMSSLLDLAIRKQHWRPCLPIRAAYRWAAA
jgi:phosphoribosylformimino-5-aminoimidazole carboxamide ribonucleotide (ProFAR) isomerase